MHVFFCKIKPKAYFNIALIEKTEHIIMNTGITRARCSKNVLQMGKEMGKVSALHLLGRE